MDQRTAVCDCGEVRFIALGNPILASACYCADCQAAAAEIASLPNAAPLAEADGGTECLLYRKDRIACTRGEDRLISMKLNEGSATKRLVAACCNTAMVMAFDDSRHWVSAYRRRFEGAPAPVEMRICMGGARADDAPHGVPGFDRYPARMMLRLVGARLAMTFRKGATIHD